MKDFLRKLRNSKYFHIMVIMLIIFALTFTTFLIILKYEVEGETKLPFEISKISIISTAQGTNKETIDTKWAFDISQNNDIFIEFNKNSKYEEIEYLKKVTIENIQISKENMKIFKPNTNVDKLMFINSNENIAKNIEYIGSTKTDLKNMEISNQGGIIAFRCANTNIAEYKSNDEEINHMELLKKVGISNEELKADIKFDLIIEFEDENKYKTNIELQLPAGDVVSKGTSSAEIIDLDNIIFKKYN